MLSRRILQLSSKLQEIQIIDTNSSFQKSSNNNFFLIPIERKSNLISSLGLSAFHHTPVYCVGLHSFIPHSTASSIVITVPCLSAASLCSNGSETQSKLKLLPAMAHEDKRI